MARTSPPESARKAFNAESTNARILGTMLVHYMNEKEEDADTAYCLKLIAEGASVHAVDKEGLSALHIACKNGKADVARALIEKGADVHLLDDRQTTPLLWAAYMGDVKAVALLMNSGADHLVRDDMNKNAKMAGNDEVRSTINDFLKARRIKGEAAAAQKKIDDNTALSSDIPAIGPPQFKKGPKP